MKRSFLLSSLAVFTGTAAHAQWEPGDILSVTSHYSACAFHDVDTGMFVYGSNNPGPSPSGTEGGIVRTTDGAQSGGEYLWYAPACNLEDIDVKMAGGKPWYIAVGHEQYNYSLVVRKELFTPNPLDFDSVRTGVGRYYCAVRMRNDFVAFAAGGTATGDGIIDMSVDTGSTWTNITLLPGQPVSRLHFVNDDLGFAVSGGYSRLFNNGVLLPDSGAIYRTTNGGLDWHQVHASTITGFSDVDFLNTEVGVATRNDGAMLRTTDGGDTWEPASVSISGSYILTSVEFRGDGLGFASAYRADGSEGLILSSNDGGANWGFNYSTAGLNGMRRIYDIYFYDDAHGYASAHWKPLVTDGLVMTVAERESAGIHLYPNPANDRVTVELPLEGSALLEVIDVLGQVLTAERITGERATLSVGALSPGTYTVRITQAGKTISQRLLRL